MSTVAGEAVWDAGRCLDAPSGRCLPQMPAASLVFTICQALVNTHRYQLPAITSHKLPLRCGRQFCVLLPPEVLLLLRFDSNGFPRESFSKFNNAIKNYNFDFISTFCASLAIFIYFLKEKHTK